MKWISLGKTSMENLDINHNYWKQVGLLFLWQARLLMDGPVKDSSGMSGGLFCLIAFFKSEEGDVRSRNNLTWRYLQPSWKTCSHQTPMWPLRWPKWTGKSLRWGCWEQTWKLKCYFGTFISLTITTLSLLEVCDQPEAIMPASYSSRQLSSEPFNVNCCLLAICGIKVIYFSLGTVS